MQTLHGNSNNIATINCRNDLLKSPVKKSYLDMISQNILENKQALNNPQEFYMGFFTNIVQEGINKRKKTIKRKKEVNSKKNGEINKSRVRNHNFLSDNNDNGKIKNKGARKRAYSTRNLIKNGIELSP